VAEWDESSRGARTDVQQVCRRLRLCPEVVDASSGIFEVGVSAASHATALPCFLLFVGDPAQEVAGFGSGSVCPLRPLIARLRTCLTSVVGGVGRGVLEWPGYVNHGAVPV